MGFLVAFLLGALAIGAVLAYYLIVAMLIAAGCVLAGIVGAGVVVAENFGPLAGVATSGVLFAGIFLMGARRDEPERQGRCPGCGGDHHHGESHGLQKVRFLR